MPAVIIDFNVQDLTHVMAGLNGLSVLCLMAGYLFIRNGERNKHRASMIAALSVSALFLVFYVIYKANFGFAKFGGEGWIRPVYFTILAAHVLGAIAITPLVPWTVYWALKEKFDRHRRLARWTWPLWMYVGVSGVAVYVMAVHLFPFQAS
jgi:putative membrane protein